MEVTSPDVTDWVEVGFPYTLTSSFSDFPDRRLSPHAFFGESWICLQLWLYRTLVYEHCAKIGKNGDSAGKKKSEEALGK